MPVRFLLSYTGWEINQWSKKSCFVHPQVGGGYAIIDENIQTRVAEADTREEASAWLGLRYDYAHDFSDRDYDDSFDF